MVPDQPRKTSTEEWPTRERIAKMLEDELRRELQARRDKLEEHRQAWIKNAPEREKREREEMECRIAELKAKGLPLPPELDPKLARELVLKEYQTKRAILWHSRYGHCSFNELKRIYVRSVKEYLFTNADFKIEDIPKCEYCTVLKQDDRGLSRTSNSDFGRLQDSRDRWDGIIGRCEVFKIPSSTLRTFSCKNELLLTGRETRLSLWKHGHSRLCEA